MSSEFRKVALGEVVELSQGLAINAKTKHLMSNDGLALLRITDLINQSETQFINENSAPEKCIANPSDIIYSRTGQVGLVFKNRKGVIHNNCFKVIPDASKLDSGYLFALLRQQYVYDYMNSVASGSVQKDLNHSAFKSLDIPLPSMSTQKFIGYFNDVLDDKIELNRKTNKTLEDIAKAIFKSWFVDFDPIHYKRDGRVPNASADTPYSLSPEILDLFPDSFQDSELGEIPAGWGVELHKDHLDFENGDRGKSYPKKSEFVEQGIAFINAGDLVNGWVDINRVDHITQEKYESLRSGKVRKGDLLYCLRGSPGRVARVGLVGTGAIASSLVMVVSDSLCVSRFG